MKVRKRDGNLEDFAFDKLLTSIMKLGVNGKDAQDIAESVKLRCEKSSQKNIISSIDIRDLVINRLEGKYSTEAEIYRSFKK